MQVQRPENMTDAQKAAWMESEEGRRFLDEAEWKPVRIVLKHPDFIPITIRIPGELRARLRGLAEQRGMGYQTLAREWLLKCYEQAKREIIEEPGLLQSQRRKWREWRQYVRHHGTRMSATEKAILNWAASGFTAFQMAHMMEPYVPVHEVERQLSALDKRLSRKREEDARRRQATGARAAVKVTPGGNS